MEINKIKNNSLVFSTNQDKLEILQSLSQKSLFLNLSFFNVFNSFLEINHLYYFHLLEKYDIKLDLSNRIKKYLPYLDVTKKYSSNKLNNLVIILKDLINSNIVDMSLIESFKNKTIYTINKMPLPSFIKAKEVIDITHSKQSNIEVILQRTETVIESSYCAYEEVIRLLRDRVSINDIVILNTSSEDDYNLLKIFNDARIPITVNKSVKLNTYPEVIALQNILKDKGYNASKSYLNNLVKSNMDGIYLPALIKIYNNYLDENLEKNPELLNALLNTQTVSQKKYIDCINIYSIDDFNYSQEKYYIVMNYSDNSLPKTAYNSHYLNDIELDEIAYLDDALLNDYYSLYYTNMIRNIDNLTLIFTRFTEEENRIANIDLKRKINTFEYHYIVKDFSYLNSLTQLEFAKTKYDFLTFFLKNENYNNLYQNYNRTIKNYNHGFTGIKNKDLKILLQKNNSITPYKLEAYTQCQFKYLLQNQLKLDTFETSVSQYIGNLSHKVLEEYTLNNTVNYSIIVDEFEGFPEELRYKEKIFKIAVKKELDELIKVIDGLHKYSMFKEILTEKDFRFPFKHDVDFDISGIIDKVMILKEDNKSDYFALIDYKLGNKDFSIDQFNKNQQLQLPMYLYAYKNMTENTMKPLGFFYQTTSLGRYNYEPNAINKNYRMKGIALNDKEVLTSFNNDLENLEGIKITSKGKLSSRKRLITEAGFQEIYDAIELKITDMITNLKAGEFKINPVPSFGSKKDSVSCEYCSFASICYNKNRKAEVKK